MRTLTSVSEPIRALQHGLIVSCQADEGGPLHGPAMMAAMAVASVAGGAVAIRARGAADIRAIKAAVQVPVIGLTKRHFRHCSVYITPTWEDVVSCIEADADIIAIDATNRPRPDGLALGEIVRRVRETSRALLMADVSCLEEGVAAADLGFDVVSTTLSGYTETSPWMAGPDFDLVSALAHRLQVPIVAEGRITTPAQAREALDRGAWAVCVGKAMTEPQFIAARFVDALREGAARAVSAGAGAGRGG